MVKCFQFSCSHCCVGFQVWVKWFGDVRQHDDFFIPDSPVTFIGSRFVVLGDFTEHFTGYNRTIVRTECREQVCFIEQDEGRGVNKNFDEFLGEC